MELWIDGRKVDRRRVAGGKPGDRMIFQPILTSSGLHRIEARLDPDTIDLDNHRYGILYVPPAVEVLVVTRKSPGGDAKRSADVYLEAALSAIGDSANSQAGLPIVVRPSVTPDQLAAAVDERVWVVILADPGPLSAEAVERLDSFVEHGGSLLIAAGSWVAQHTSPAPSIMRRTSASSILPMPLTCTAA